MSNTIDITLTNTADGYRQMIDASQYGSISTREQVGDTVTYTITLTDVQPTALEWIAPDPA